MALDLNKRAFGEVPETLHPQKGKEFPVTFQEFVRGGFQSFVSMEQADRFPMQRRNWGMMANIAGLIHGISDDLTTWNPAEKGYLTFNPTSVNMRYNIIYPFNYRVLSITAHQVSVIKGFQNGAANKVQHIVLSGNPDSAITFEIYKWY